MPEPTIVVKFIGGPAVAEAQRTFSQMETAANAANSRMLAGAKRYQEQQSLMTRTGQAFRKGSQYLDKMGSKMIRLGSSGQMLGMRLTTSLTMPISLAAIATGKLAYDFDQSMRFVAAAAGTTQAKTDRAYQSMRSSALAASRTTIYSAKESADGLYELVSAGFSAREAAKELLPVLRFVESSNLAVGDATQFASAQWHLWGGGARGLNRIFDVTAVAVQKSQAHFSDFTHNVAMSGVQAKQSGQSYEELAAAIMVASDRGMPLARIGFNLREMLRTMWDPSKKASEALKAIGDYSYYSHGKMKPLHQIAGELRGRMKDLDQEHKNLYLSWMFGARGGMVMRTMMELNAKEMDKYQRAVNGAAGAHMRMAKTVEESDSAKFQKSLHRLQAAGITLGTKLLPEATKALKIIDGLAESFNRLPADTQDKILKIALGLAAIGPFVKIGSAMITVGGFAAKAVGLLGRAFFGTGAAAKTASAQMALFDASTVSAGKSSGALASMLRLPVLAAVAARLYSAKQAYDSLREKGVYPLMAAILTLQASAAGGIITDWAAPAILTPLRNALWNVNVDIDLARMHSRNLLSTLQEKKAPTALILGAQWLDTMLAGEKEVYAYLLKLTGQKPTKTDPRTVFAPRVPFKPPKLPKDKWQRIADNAPQPGAPFKHVLREPTISGEMKHATGLPSATAMNAAKTRLLKAHTAARAGITQTKTVTAGVVAATASNTSSIASYWVSACATIQSAIQPVLATISALDSSIGGGGGGNTRSSIGTGLANRGTYDPGGPTERGEGGPESWGDRVTKRWGYRGKISPKAVLAAALASNSLLGVRYVLGAMGLGGGDCSGQTSYVAGAGGWMSGRLTSGSFGGWGAPEGGGPQPFSVHGYPPRGGPYGHVWHTFWNKYFREATGPAYHVMGGDKSHDYERVPIADSGGRYYNGRWHPFVAVDPTRETVFVGPDSPKITRPRSGHRGVRTTERVKSFSLEGIQIEITGDGIAKIVKGQISAVLETMEALDSWETELAGT